jgi:hypothetical protein
LGKQSQSRESSLSRARLLFERDILVTCGLVSPS